MKEKIRLKIPNEQELEYRRQLISDEETMSYNMGYGDNGGCTYIRTYEQVRLWYKNWSNNKDRFYSYIVRNSDNKFIGEVNIYKSNPWFEMGIVIESKYRGMGYSSYALKLLLYHAFENMNANAVHNSFEDTRTAAIKTHISAGFKEIKHQNGIIEFLITKEEYYMLNALKNKKYKAYA